MAQDYGTITFQGRRYILQQDAVLSDRLFTGSWHDTSEPGDAYVAEWMAHATDDAGEDFTVYWQFPAVRGEEPEDDSNWPWGDEHITRVEIR